MSTSTMSAVHYGTFRNLDSLLSCALYPIGLAVLMGGVVVLVQESAPAESVIDDHARLEEPLLAGSEHSTEDEAMTT